MQSPIFTLSRIVVISCIGLSLISCASNKKIQSPISTTRSELLSSDKIMIHSRIINSNIFSLERNYVNLKNKHIIYNRNYRNIPKGSYVGNTYIVKKGDTLFYIAWITGNDFHDLANKNNIIVPYNNLKIGQVLQISNNTSLFTTNNNVTTKITTTRSSTKNHSSSENIKTFTVLKENVINHFYNSKKIKGKDKITPLSKDSKITILKSTRLDNKVNAAFNTTSISGWYWPTHGQIIDSFSNAEGGNKGIDIGGIRGQPIMVTASGRVIYAGNALHGYGNLIIIKHNNDYLSAYAHNDKIFVREKQEVKIGQQIATMGSTGTSSVKLHFEIRYKGKPVNPLHYLP